MSEVHDRPITVEHQFIHEPGVWFGLPSHRRHRERQTQMSEYGFTWGLVEVSRLTNLGKEGKVLGVKTPRGEIQVRVTPTGLIRIYPISGNVSFESDRSK